MILGWVRYLHVAFAIVFALATGGCSMAQFAPEKFFDGPELQVAVAIEAKDNGRLATAMPGANLNRVGREGITLLFYAFNLKNYPAMTALVKAGANPEYEVQGFGSPMTVAVDQEDPSALKALLAGGANPNANYSSDTPIIFKAADDDKMEHLKALLDAGANPNKTDSLGETAIFESMSISSYDATKFLIERGADVKVMSHRGLTFAWVVQDKLNFQKNNSSHFPRAQEIQRLCEAQGVKFPPDPPQVVRQKLGIPE
jgi:uncharacterized protein